MVQPGSPTGHAERGEASGLATRGSRFFAALRLLRMTIKSRHACGVMLSAAKHLFCRTRDLHISKKVRNLNQQLNKGSPMPRYPEFADRVRHVPGSVFEKFQPEMARQGQNLVRLHIGDTVMKPEFPLPLHESFVQNNPDFNRYCNTFGIPEFRAALRDKLNEDNRFQVSAENILVSNGATSALSAAVMSILNKGDEIILLTPCWPLFANIVRTVEAKIIEVPVYDRLYREPELDLAAVIEPYISKRTAAIYLNSPNNPSGKVVAPAQLAQLAGLVRTHNLWLLSDEAYDGLTFDGHTHYSIAAKENLLDQTISVFTFSKIFMFAGIRLGYAVAAESVIRTLNSIMVHQIYSPATFSQQMMIEPVRTRGEWSGRVRDQYRQARDETLAQLQVDVIPPEASYFLFFDVEPYLAGREMEELVMQCYRAGVSVAPGIEFGAHYRTWLRLCFTGETPERMRQGIDRLNRVISAK
jgi:aspartate/methionine/tyrosine aminotransferase